MGEEIWKIVGPALMRGMRAGAKRIGKYFILEYSKLLLYVDSKIECLPEERRVRIEILIKTLERGV